LIDIAVLLPAASVVAVHLVSRCAAGGLTKACQVSGVR
jgi:hypothetical protein